MNNQVLAAIVFAELVTGLYLRWAMPGLWGPWALVAAIYLMAGTFAAWGHLETFVDRRRCLARMKLMRSAVDPWRSYRPSTAEMAEHAEESALGSRR